LTTAGFTVAGLATAGFTVAGLATAGFGAAGFAAAVFAAAVRAAVAFAVVFAAFAAVAAAFAAFATEVALAVAALADAAPAVAAFAVAAFAVAALAAVDVAERERVAIPWRCAGIAVSFCSIDPAATREVVPWAFEGVDPLPGVGRDPSSRRRSWWSELMHLTSVGGHCKGAPGERSGSHVNTS
jgi:hypothetical protein